MLYSASEKILVYHYITRKAIRQVGFQCGFYAYFILFHDFWLTKLTKIKDAIYHSREKQKNTGIDKGKGNRRAAEQEKRGNIKRQPLPSLFELFTGKKINGSQPADCNITCQ